MKLFNSLRNAALAIMLLSAGAANATLLDFKLTGGYTASWQLDLAPTPDDYGNGQAFVVWNVPGFPDAALDVADIYFFNAVEGGGLEIYDFWSDTDLVVTDGLQLYSGSEANPVFNLGTFALTEYQGTQTYILTIALADIGGGGANVPEPATGALLLGGLGIMYVLRKRVVSALPLKKMQLAA